MNPVGCAVGPPITGQLNLEGIPVLGLVDTGASVTRMGFSVWWQYHTQWGPLKPFEGVVHGAHGKPLQIAGKTQHLNLQWGEARGRASFIVIIGLESPPVLIGMDIMRPDQCHQRHRYAHAAGPTNHSSQRRPSTRPPFHQSRSAATSTFAARGVSYLGHRVTEEGLPPDPALLAAIRDISSPQNATEVRSFWVSPGTTDATSETSQPSPDRYMP